MGVHFTGGGERLQQGDEQKVTLVLMYFPEVDYSTLEAGATFTIREGGTVVGFGVVDGIVTS